MHGLINRAVQSFVTHTYGQATWVRVAEAGELGFAEFEAMLVYDDDLTSRVLDALGAELDRSPAGILEDLGTFLVCHPSCEAPRRLLRFGGVTYVDFLHSLDDLPDRTRLAVSDLVLPPLELEDETAGRFTLTCHAGLPGYGSVMVGILRAMADDYGALAMLEHAALPDGSACISVTLVESDYAEGRRFELGARAG